MRCSVAGSYWDPMIEIINSVILRSHHQKQLNKYCVTLQSLINISAGPGKSVVDDKSNALFFMFSASSFSVIRKQWNITMIFSLVEVWLRKKLLLLAEGRCNEGMLSSVGLIILVWLNPFTFKIATICAYSLCYVNCCMSCASNNLSIFPLGDEPLWCMCIDWFGWSNRYTVFQIKHCLVVRIYRDGEPYLMNMYWTQTSLGSWIILWILFLKWRYPPKYTWFFFISV